MAMVQMGQDEACEMTRYLQVWRALADWFGFFFQVIAPIVRGVPSLAQVLSYVGVGHPLFASTSLSFKPLPVTELPLHQSSAPSAAADQRLEKLTVVLDLDETLVCAYESNSLPSTAHTQAAEAGLKWFELECVSSDKECEGKPKITFVTAYERPGLQEFLNQIGEFADLILFTAGLEGYASPLVDRIDKENRFILRLYRPSTVSTEHREHVKDLSCLSTDPARTVIVDNNPFSFLLQPLNGVPCISFSATKPQDDQLLEVILPLLKHLSIEKDVRPVLYKRFHMPEWFQMHGIPVSPSTV